MRSRNIKPGFFKNEYLAECSFQARLLFAGLWCLADRDGRMEYRKKRIKAEIFPFDDADVSTLVQELCKYGFVRVYSAGGCDYLDIPAFLKNQNPHQNEKSFDLPTYENRDVLAKNRDSGTSTMLVQELYKSDPDESCIMNQESGIMCDAPKPRTRKQFSIPSVEQCREYAVAISIPANEGDAFHDHFTARDWRFKDGKKMCDWQASMRTWKRNMNAFGKGEIPKPKPQLPNLADVFHD